MRTKKKEEKLSPSVLKCSRPVSKKERLPNCARETSWIRDMLKNEKPRLMLRSCEELNNQSSTRLEFSQVSLISVRLKERL